MKKTLCFVATLAFLLTSCGPAAEDRKEMDRLAKRMSDSLAHLIDSSLAEPFNYVNMQQAPAPAPATPADTAKPAAH